MNPRVLKVVPVGSYFSADKLHDKAVAHGEKQFKLHGGCLPTWLMWENNAVTFIETPWEHPAEKEATVALMRDAINNRHHVDAYSLLVEAWVASQKVGDTEIIAPRLRPKNERDDVLLAWTFSKTERPKCARWLVTVRKHGPNFLGPRDDLYLSGADHMEGLLWNLYEPEPTVQ